MKGYVHESDVDFEQVDMAQVAEMLHYVQERQEYGGRCAFWDRKGEIIERFEYISGNSQADRQQAEHFIVRYLMRDMLDHAKWWGGSQTTLGRVNAHTKTAIAMALFDLFLQPEIADRLRHAGREIPRFLTKWQHPWPDRSYRRCPCTSQKRRT